MLPVSSPRITSVLWDNSARSRSTPGIKRNAQRASSSGENIQYCPPSESYSPSSNLLPRNFTEASWNNSGSVLPRKLISSIVFSTPNRSRKDLFMAFRVASSARSSRLCLLQVLQQKSQGDARIHDVLDHQHIPSLHVKPQALHHFHLTRCLLP